MDPVFKKMNFKDQPSLLVLHAPESFRQHLEAISEIAELQESPETGKKYPFAVVFAVSAEELTARGELALRHLTEEDPIFWLAYPKKSSKKYTSDINRDSDAWLFLGEHGFEGVRQVAIDEDWSALRFRHVDFIKTMKRQTLRAMSEKGKKRTS